MASMFEVPEAKRVKRSRIFSFGSASSLSEDEQGSVTSSNNITTRQKSANVVDYSKSSKTKVQNAMHEQVVRTDDNDATVNYGFEYDFIDKNLETDNVVESARNQQEHSKEQIFEFQLFKPSLNSKMSDPNNKLSVSSQTAQLNASKITIRSPTPETSFLGLGLGLGSGTQQSGSILKPRPQSYYFTTIFNDTSNKQQNQRLKSEYEQVAVTSEDVTNLSKTRWQGTHLAWRIIRIKPSDNKVRISESSSSGAHARINGRTRPGKKRRIVMRRRVQMRRLLAEETKVAAQKADEAEKEKRTRKNREKKVRKKEREKQKKLEARAGSEAGAGTVDGTSSEAQ